ncbi:hypothetical protein NM688_g8533 [Phlebia brevispora]|uniref:Uncharacterized protein n=1 Tax=Phlebia brevispora TaxID=194682 RepID=A0ACC1RTS8_9APHY|nr:hypothetical protein NM688_g8533 [Phlebia brevispora]
MSSIVPLALAVLAVLVVSLRRTRRFRLPPGPKGVPLLGNVFDMPKKEEWLTYAKWSKEYDSDILYLNLVGTNVIVVNSVKHASELFDKRSSIYNDRPDFTMVDELMGWDFSFAFQRYGDGWRERRRLFHHHFNAQAITAYYPRIFHEVRGVLNHLYEEPDKFMDHIRHMEGSLILGITYGIQVKPKNDPYIAAAGAAVHGLAVAGNAGAFLVDVIPALKYVPAWFPGAGFKKQAAEWRQNVSDMVTLPFSAAKSAMANGTASSSVVSSLISDLNVGKNDKDTESIIQQVAGAAYAAGSDTALSVLATFVLAMVLYPEVQKKAREELDRVIGQDRLPTFEDDTQLPYITAIYREAMRWRPVTPLAPPHRLMRDDEYLGYTLPKDSMVVGNIWAILHDEAIYRDADEFNPDRFIAADGSLDTGLLNPEDFAFGFGRRICPGRYLAAALIRLMMAAILTTFEINLPVDKEGRKIVPTGEYTVGLVVYPKPFPCVFKPRSAFAENLVRTPVHDMDA